MGDARAWALPEPIIGSFNPARLSTGQARLISGIGRTNSELAGSVAVLERLEDASAASLSLSTIFQLLEEETLASEELGV